MITFLNGIYLLLNYVLTAYSYVIIIDVIMSWVPQARQSKLGEIVGKLVDPLFDVIDRFIPTIGGMSFSPIVAFFLIYLVRRLLSLLFFGVF